MGIDVRGGTPADPTGPVSWLDTMRKEATGLGDALSSGVTGVLDGIADAIRGIFNPQGPYAKIGVAASEFRDGQLGLERRQDLIDVLLNYGSCYNPSSPQRAANSWFKVNFTQQLGAMRGVETVPDGGLKLLHAGLWDIRTQLTFGSAFGLLERFITWEVRVVSPDGDTFSRQAGYEEGREKRHGTIVSSVMVPDPGYTVEVWVHSQNYRGSIVGYGPVFSRLTVQQVNSRTDVGADGSENSGLDNNGKQE